MGILKYNAKTVAQVCLLYLIDIDSVISDLSVLDIIETVDKIGNGSLPGTC